MVDARDALNILRKKRWVRDINIYIDYAFVEVNFSSNNKRRFDDLVTDAIKSLNSNGFNMAFVSRYSNKETKLYQDKEANTAIRFDYIPDTDEINIYVYSRTF